jgi:hypothetical protein
MKRLASIILLLCLVGCASASTGQLPISDKDVVKGSYESSVPLDEDLAAVVRVFEANGFIVYNQDPDVGRVEAATQENGQPKMLEAVADAEGNYQQAVITLADGKDYVYEVVYIAAVSGQSILVSKSVAKHGDRWRTKATLEKDLLNALKQQVSRDIKTER